MTDINLFLAELSKQKDNIQSATDQIDQGTIPDMTEIDRDLSALVGAIEIAPAEIAKQTEEGLRELISMLEYLAGRIQDFQKSLEG